MTPSAMTTPIRLLPRFAWRIQADQYLVSFPATRVQSRVACIMRGDGDSKGLQVADRLGLQDLSNAVLPGRSVPMACFGARVTHEVRAESKHHAKTAGVRLAQGRKLTSAPFDPYDLHQSRHGAKDANANVHNQAEQTEDDYGCHGLARDVDYLGQCRVERLGAVTMAKDSVGLQEGDAARRKRLHCLSCQLSFQLSWPLLPSSLGGRDRRTANL